MTPSNKRVHDGGKTNSNKKAHKRSKLDDDSQDHVDTMAGADEQDNETAYQTPNKASDSRDPRDTRQRPRLNRHDSRLSAIFAPKATGIGEAKASSPPQKVGTSLPKLRRYQRIQPTAVKSIENQGIRNPAGGEKPTKTKSRMLNALKKLEDTYENSSIGSKQVRMLIVKPGQEYDDINAILQVVDEDQLGNDDYCYEALSYHWG